MAIPAAYIVVIIVWSTTPLGVQWSSQGMSPIAGAASRMLLGAILGWVVTTLLGIRVPTHQRALRIYGISNISLFFGLTAVYLGAVYIPSGMISVLFGLSPITSAVLARCWLCEPPFTLNQWLALLLGVTGLCVTFSQDFQLAHESYLGIGLVLLGMLCFSASGVLLKREKVSLHPLAHTVGSLTLAAPLYLIAAVLLDARVDSLQPKAVAAILYLTFFGSFIGFFCYFYILKHLTASTVALVTLITPVIAISLGVWVNHEPLTPNLLAGAGMICGCLLLFYWGSSISKLRLLWLGNTE